MTAEQAHEFVCQHGIVLESARGPVPSLAEFIAQEPIDGSWWTHARSKEIFAVTRALRDSGEILVCRLICGKITFVHRRLWPSLVRVADNFTDGSLARLDERHTAAGRHALVATPFPAWVPADVMRQADRLEASAAWELLRSCAPKAFVPCEQKSA